MPHWYYCTSMSKYGIKACFHMDGRDLDRAVERIVLAQLRNPSFAALNKALAEENKTEAAEESYIQKQRQRLEYRERHLEEQIENCDPKNRLVYDRFTHQLNQTLEERQKFENRVIAEALQRKRLVLTEEKLQELCESATLIVDVWHNPNVTPRERKEIIRCLIEEVRLTPDGDLYKGKIRWRAGGESFFRFYRRDACDNLIRELHREGCTTREIVERLARGETSTGQVFDRKTDNFNKIYKRLGLKPHRKSAWKMALMREATLRRSKGETCRSIAEDFNDRGIKSSRGKLWTAELVMHLFEKSLRLSDPLEDIHIRAFLDAKSRGLTFVQMAQEFNQNGIPRRNKCPWHPVAIRCRWLVLKRRIETERSMSKERRGKQVVGKNEASTKTGLFSNRKESTKQEK